MPTFWRAPRLMLVTDARRARLPLAELVAEAVAGGVDAIYLRDVDLTRDDLGALVSEPRVRIGAARGNEGTACRAPTVCAFTINGEPEAVRALGIGLHLRERDLAPAAARTRLGWDLPIGKSVHAPGQAALATGADYVLAGHVYPTVSKPGRPPLGLSGLATIVDAAPCPTLAIGGITAERVADVIAAGAAGIAVIGAISEADDPRAAAADLRDALDSALGNTTRSQPWTNPPPP